MDLAAKQVCAIRFCVGQQKSVAEIAWMMKKAQNDKVLGTSIVF